MPKTELSGFEELASIDFFSQKVLADVSKCKVDVNKIRYKPFGVDDISKLYEVNLDDHTFVFDTSFYLSYAIENYLGSRVAIDEYGEIVGYLLGTVMWTCREMPKAHISVLTVTYPYRSTGVAHNLMRYFEEAAFALGATYVDLFVDQTNGRAIKFYKNRNYKIENVIEHYYGLNKDAYQMVLCRPTNLHNYVVISDENSLETACEGRFGL